ncbi:Uncharacterised protein [Chlamydia trachomatis]|nr:Uncharacterised protein [Chlamydia trachomatis]
MSMTGVALAFRGGFAPPVFISRVCQAAGTPMIVPATDSAGDTVRKSATATGWGQATSARGTPPG